MNNFLDNIYFGNSLQKWLIALGIIFIGLVVVYFVKVFAVKGFKKWSKRTDTTFDDFLVSLFEKCLVPYLYFVSIAGAVYTLELSAKASRIFHVVILLVTTFYVVKAINATLQYLIYSFLQRHDEGKVKQRQVSGIIVIFKIIVWVVGIIFLLDNLGYNITTIVAGLGIGGIAIALAAQTFLGDLFCYFVILFDRPFEIGDFITVDDKMGEVEFIGIKTTRLRSLGGEQLICSNRYLTESRVHNFKRLQKRRVSFNLGVTYQTSPEMLEAIPGIVKEIISAKPDILFDRVHFVGFGNFSLNFEIVYFFLTADFNAHMDLQQQIFYEIYREFSNKEIAFAYPTQTLFINRDNAMNFQEQTELAGVKEKR